MSRFEWITSAEPECLRPAHDHPVIQTEHFVALPTLGSMVTGWLLVVPRRKMDNLSFLDATERQALKSIVATLAGVVRAKESEVYLFEHGGHAGSTIACGVDQAHLHLVPLSFDLVAKALEASDVQWTTLHGGEIPWGSNDPSEYLSVCRAGDAWHLGRPCFPTSQWFRKLIAAELGIPERWDYRQYPHHPIMASTLDLLERTNG